jgi:hypothetical protein
MHVDPQPWTDGGELSRGDLGLRTADVGGTMEQLPVQVREFDAVPVDEADPIDSVGDNLDSRGGTETTDTNDHDGALNSSTPVAKPRQAARLTLATVNCELG